MTSCKNRFVLARSPLKSSGARILISRALGVRVAMAGVSGDVGVDGEGGAGGGGGAVGEGGSTAISVSECAGEGALNQELMLRKCLGATQECYNYPGHVTFPSSHVNTTITCHHHSVTCHLYLLFICHSCAL